MRPNSDGIITPMVAVRSTGLASDTVIGYRNPDGKMLNLVDESYLRTLVNIANDRFRVNGERINKFRCALRDAYKNSNKSNTSFRDWEDPIARKERKRAEGLQRQIQKRNTRFAQAQSARDSVKTDENISFQAGLGLPE